MKKAVFVMNHCPRQIDLKDKKNHKYIECMLSGKECSCFAYHEIKKEEDGKKDAK